MGPIRLINTKTVDLEELWDTPVRYAILSHRWVDEVTFQQWKDHRAEAEIRKKGGYTKIRAFCHLAYDDGFDYVWVDTNCIDKTNSSELSEAINSMFSWYRDAARCYVYLHDLEIDLTTGLPQKLEAARCEWFTRGWTLQELLAPRNLWFYSKDWTCIGSKVELSDVLLELTGIDEVYLHDPQKIHEASVAKRISWASNRKTGKAEDIAYSLLGVFDINMPLLYGEGGLKAFRRLQEEIIKVSTDQTIFAWEWPSDWKPSSPDWVTFFAPSPSAFKNSQHFISDENYDVTDNHLSNIYSMDNLGLSITLPILDTISLTRYSFAAIKCTDAHDHRTAPMLLGIPVYICDNLCTRCPFPSAPTPVSALRARDMVPIHICRYGNKFLNKRMYLFYKHVQIPSLVPNNSSARYHFMCFSIDKETPSFGLSNIGATPRSSVFSHLGLVSIEQAPDEYIATGIVAFDHGNIEIGHGSGSSHIVLYLGVILRGGALSYYCDIQSARNSISVRDEDINSWNRRLRELSRRPLGTSSDNGGEREIGKSSECSRGVVHLGKPVDQESSIFIPVYISIKGKSRSSGYNRPSSLIVEGGGKTRIGI